MAGLISNGTYVLGDLNTRDLYLGKGLKQGIEGDKWYIAADETVLWEGSQSGLFTITLSEPITNFEKLFIVGCWNDSLTSQFSDYVYIDSLKLASPIQKGFFGCTGWGKKYWFLQISGNTVTCSAAKETQWGTNTVTNMTNFSIQKVIGINRKREEV